MSTTGAESIVREVFFANGAVESVEYVTVSQNIAHTAGTDTTATLVGISTGPLAVTISAHGLTWEVTTEGARPVFS